MSDDITPRLALPRAARPGGAGERAGGGNRCAAAESGGGECVDRRRRADRRLGWAGAGDRGMDEQRVAVRGSARRDGGVERGRRAGRTVRGGRLDDRRLGGIARVDRRSRRGWTSPACDSRSRRRHRRRHAGEGGNYRHIELFTRSRVDWGLKHPKNCVVPATPLTFVNLRGNKPEDREFAMSV